MKTIILFAIMFFTTQIYCQKTFSKSEVINRIADLDFKSYVKDFEIKSLPIDIPSSYKEIFDNVSKGISYEIKSDYVKKYILNKPKTKYDTDRYYYTHSFFIGGSAKYFALIFTKTDYKPSIAEGLSLYESILVTYDFSGQIISSITIAQESDRRYMISTISENNEVNTKSIVIKNKGTNWPKIVSSDQIVEKYKIENDGKIIKTYSNVRKDVKISRDESLSELINFIK